MLLVQAWLYRNRRAEDSLYPTRGVHSATWNVLSRATAGFRPSAWDLVFSLFRRSSLFCIRLNTLFIHPVGLWFDVSCSWWTILFQTQLFYRWFRALRWLLLKTLENLLSFFKADTFRAKVVSKKGSAVVLCRVVMTSLWIVVIILAATLVHWSLLLALQTPRWCLRSFGTPRSAVALGREDLAECGVQNDLLRGAFVPSRRPASMWLHGETCLRQP